MKVINAILVIIFLACSTMAHAQQIPPQIPKKVPEKEGWFGRIQQLFIPKERITIKKEVYELPKKFCIPVYDQKVCVQSVKLHDKSMKLCPDTGDVSKDCNGMTAYCDVRIWLFETPSESGLRRYITNHTNALFCEAALQRLKKPAGLPPFGGEKMVDNAEFENYTADVYLAPPVGNVNDILE